MSLADSITVSLLLRGARDRIVKHSALRRRRSDITARFRPRSRVASGFRTLHARRKRVCTANNKQPSASTGFSIARVNEERRKEHTDEERKEEGRGIRGAFCRGNEDDSETWMRWTETPGTERRQGRREICAVFASVFRTGALLRYHRRAIAPSLPAFCLISSPAKAETKTPQEKDVTEKMPRHPREVLTRVNTDASLLSLPC